MGSCLATYLSVRALDSVYADSPCSVFVTVQLVIEGGEDPLLQGLVLAALKLDGDRPRPIAIEIRADELSGLLGGLQPLGHFLEGVGAVLVIDGIEIRTRRTGIGRGRFMPIYHCRACAGDGCLRCGRTGECRGKS